MERIDPDAALAYNIHLTALLSGPLDEDALQLAVAALVRRHEVLRSRFPDSADARVAEPFLWVPLQRHDLAPEAVDGWFAGEASRRFDLAEGPLLRAQLLRLGAGSAQLVLSLPHIIGDGVTLNLLLRELVQLYEGERAAAPPGCGSPCPSMPTQPGWKPAALPRPRISHGGSNSLPDRCRC
ncbi:condensation domain-containing protein [Pseudoroseomonas wenyumeiae]